MSTPPVTIEFGLSSLLRAIAGSLGIRIFASGLGFVSGILLARLLGATGLGVFAFVQSIVGTLAVISSLGFIQLLVRETAIQNYERRWDLMHGWFSLAARVAVTASIVIVILAAALVSIFADRSGHAPLTGTLLVALTALPFLVLTTLRQAAMRGLKFITLSMVPDMVARPAILFCLLGATYILFGRNSLTPQIPAAFVAVTVICASFISTALHRYALPADAKHNPHKTRPDSWLQKATPLYLIAVMQILNMQADILMLGYLSETREVGVYSVTRGLAEFIIFVLAGAAFVMAPNIAHFYTSKEFAHLQYLIRKASQAALAGAIPLILIYSLAGNWILSLYGQQFVDGRQSLLILSAGQFINVLCGPTGQIAVHTGNERFALFIVGIATATNIILNALLIPEYGANGAAIATASTLALWNIGLSIMIRYRTGLSSLPFSLSFRKSCE